MHTHIHGLQLTFHEVTPSFIYYREGTLFSWRIMSRLSDYYKIISSQEHKGSLLHFHQSPPLIPRGIKSLWKSTYTVDHKTDYFEFPEMEMWRRTQRSKNIKLYTWAVPAQAWPRTVQFCSHRVEALHHRSSTNTCHPKLSWNLWLSLGITVNYYSTLLTLV